MIDIEKHVSYWRTTAEIELEVASDLHEKKRLRQALFFCHLALEKHLKALVCRTTKDIAPRINNLVRLSELAQIKFNEKEIGFLFEMTGFNMESRYPDMLNDEPSHDLVKDTTVLKI